MRSLSFIFLPLALCSLVACKNYSSKHSQINNTMEAPYNIVEKGDNTFFNYDTLSKDIINFGANSLKGFNYQFPEYDLFQKRIVDVFGLNIDSYNNQVLPLRNSDFPEIVIKEKLYLLIQDSESDGEYFISSDVLYNFNKYIFYKDKLAFNVLKLRAPFLLKDLVIHYGYTEDKDLISFVLKEFDFSNEISFHELIFGVENNQFVLRKDVLESIENVIYGGKTNEILSEAKHGNGYDSLSKILAQMYTNCIEYHACNESIAFLCEKALNVGDIGDVQVFINNNKKFIDEILPYNYYENERLRMFCENLNVFSESATGIIQDPDGYTNLRKDKNTSSTIIEKIKSGEEVYVLDNSRDWWLIETKEGKQGYVHKSRIKS